ncbi:hypothetical protein GCM10008018_56840 [Paenibacillus marchantiophytorum]|uniref:Uncharacterized protein n=1 Tax=Paenibacillus marchantiophytorum TaxID=1619310 RepID=A0ABQ1F9Q7_9BACL|nr:hypothetical protein GCM10008018_56840 [Paenibacillus marchantiophytorum]
MLIINSFAAGAMSYVAKSDYKKLLSVIRAAMCEITPIQTLMSVRSSKEAIEKVKSRRFFE